MPSVRYILRLLTEMFHGYVYTEGTNEKETENKRE